MPNYRDESVAHESFDEAEAAMKEVAPFCTECGAPMKMTVETVDHDAKTGDEIQMYVSRCTKATGIVNRVLDPDAKKDHFWDVFGHVRRP